MRDFSLKVCVLACLACGLTSCDEGKFNDAKCDETYVAECLDQTHFMFCDNGELRVTACGQDAYCTTQKVGTDAEGKPVMGAAECRLADNSEPERVPVVTADDRCKEGEVKCDGNNAMVCKNSIWEISRKCGVACKDGACTGAPGLEDEEQAASCTEEGKNECVGTNSRTCIGGTWVVNPCTDPCDASTGKCGASSEACTEEGKNECVGTNSRTCIGGTWVVNPCTDPCDASTGKCGASSEACTEEGKNECVGTNSRTCTGGTWVVNPCTDPCDASTGKCGASSEACTEEGKNECVGTNSRTCTGGVWKENTCNNGCDEATGQCNDTETPKPDETDNKCTDEELADCKSNEYKACAIFEGEVLCYDDTCTQEGNPKYTCEDDEYGIYSYYEECVKADDGSLVVFLDYNDCSSQKCDKSTGQCVKSVSDEFGPCEDNYPDRCENNYVVYCDKDYGVVAAASCGKDTCLTVDAIADCYGESDKCTELDNTKKACIEEGGYGYDVTLTCKKASDNNTYWTLTDGDECPNNAKCNEKGDACEGSEG